MGMFNVHTTYEDVLGAPTTVEEIQQAVHDDPRGERNLVWKSGGTYYVLNRTEILPIAVPLTWVGLNTTARNLSDALRPTIDEAYDNPEQGHGIGTSDVGSKDSPSVTQASRTPAHEALPVKAENTSETRDVEHEHRTAAEVSATAPPSEEGAPPSVEKSESTVSRAALASKEDERAERAARAEAKKAERDAKREERQSERELRAGSTAAEPSPVRTDIRESARESAHEPAQGDRQGSDNDAHDGKRADNGADE